MNKTLAISAISLIAVMMVIGVMPTAIAKEGNNGSNGCIKSNAKSKACEKNPNSTPVGPTCQGCYDAYEAAIIVCNAIEERDAYRDCRDAAYEAFNACYDSLSPEALALCPNN